MKAIWLLLTLSLANTACARAPSTTELEACFVQCPSSIGSLWRWSLQELENPGFRIGWSRYHRSPAWVAYQLDPATDRREIDRRPEGYTVDTRTFFAVRSEDYRGAGYDRGHLAANYVMSRFFGVPAQEAAMRMSNIAPQTARLNRGVWQRLEAAEVDIWLRGSERVWVVTGPIWEGRSSRIGGGVHVPTAFYRLWVRQPQRGDATVIAFRVPQVVCGDEPPSRYVVPLAEVSAAVGLDFGPLTALPEVGLTRREQQAMDRLPLRYAADFRKTPRPSGCAQ